MRKQEKKETPLEREKKKLSAQLSNPDLEKPDMDLIKGTIQNVRKRFRNFEEPESPSIEYKWDKRKAGQITLGEVAFLLLDFHKVATDNLSLRFKVAELEKELSRSTNTSGSLHRNSE
eukprot:TRINITY_DN4925_c0_g2_i4.p1 TRINITY_DN4925_c0_g2~~TRINITY_DN4925_c0_g2_i4.p1  ORF type:complete len:118 (+),score=36.58 TRINITY_DN4925_c0_g2_i4:561-914(+)